MKSYLIIFSSPLFNQYLSFLKSDKDFPVKQFIPEPTVKRFNITALLGTARFDVQGLDA
jgi:hypothetical protein